MTFLDVLVQQSINGLMLGIMLQGKCHDLLDDERVKKAYLGQ